MIRPFTRQRKMGQNLTKLPDFNRVDYKCPPIAAGSRGHGRRRKNLFATRIGKPLECESQLLAGHSKAPIPTLTKRLEALPEFPCNRCPAFQERLNADNCVATHFDSR